jgi:hypothetical protein
MFRAGYLSLKAMKIKLQSLEENPVRVKADYDRLTKAIASFVEI